MPTNLDADLVLAAFASNLSDSVARDGWQLVRFVTSHSDRAFSVRKDRHDVTFTAKMSQSEPPWWGLTRSKASEMERDGKEHLVLLVSESSGYFVPNPILRRLMRQFSRTKSGDIRINAGRIRAQARFRDTDDLWELLKERL